MNNVLSYVYDFISMIYEDGDVKDKVNNIILFGSIAKGTYDKKSDIDIFFDVSDVNSVKNTEKKLKSVLKSFEVKVERTWGLKDIRFPINLIVGSLEDSAWKNLKEEMISSGIVLYGSYNEIPGNLEHDFLFFYSLKTLDRKNKMKFIRKFFGYTLIKDKKEYVQKGLLEKIGGTKLSSNVILVSSKSILNVKSIFNEFEIEYKVKEAWIRE